MRAHAILTLTAVLASGCGSGAGLVAVVASADGLPSPPAFTMTSARAGQ